MDIGPMLQAKASDLQTLYGLLVEASAWLRGKGLTQWSKNYPLQRFAREVDAARVWYWAIGGEPVATVALHQRRPEYYPPGVWEEETAALYVCRLAVARKFAGHRVGEQVLAAIERDVGSGVRVLRLDVTASNPFLEAYYLARGFERCHIVEILGDPCVLLEKSIGRQ